MDVSSFLGGSYLTQHDLPLQPAVWTVVGVTQQQVGTDQKIVVQFREHQKGLGLNKTNLRAIAQAYGTNAQAWIGRQLELFKDVTFFQGRQTPCIRVRIPAAPLQQPQAAMMQPPQPAQPYQPQPAQLMTGPAPQQPLGVIGSPGAPPWGSL